MQKSSKILGLVLIAFVFVFFINNNANSNISENFKVAIVDVQKVVSNSSEVNALRQEQKNKIADLTSFVEKAKADVAKETDATKKKALEDKYNQELNLRRDTIQKEYVKNLTAIDKNITAAIQAKATQGHYNLVLAKNVVLMGGTDITADISKAVK